MGLPAYEQVALPFGAAGRSRAGHRIYETVLSGSLGIPNSEVLETGRHGQGVCRAGTGGRGFCRINDSRSPIYTPYWAPLFENELGGIGPLGIDERYRGLNYGLAIVQAGISFLLQRGIRQIVIDTTPFVDFYGKHGFKIWKYEKALDA